MTSAEDESSSRTPPMLDGWRLVPEGGILHQALRIAVIADVHLGYEWARGSAGDCVPRHSLAETLEKLGTMFGRAVVERLIVAGDLVESPRPCARTRDDLTRLVRWLRDREVQLVLLRGNHDRGLVAPAGSPQIGSPASGVRVENRLNVAGWTIVHGHAAVSAKRLISGHHHPVLNFAGRASPCFLAGPDRIILPAFSNNAAGLDVASARLPAAWHKFCLHCFASTGKDVLDFGPLESLASRLRAAGTRPEAPSRNARRARRSPLDLKGKQS